MTSPRSEVYNPDIPQWFHCFSRCVRRAFLCGWDSFSGKSYEHRREWIRTRLAELSKLFSIQIATFSIMENHLHIVCHTRPDLAEKWSAKEVARRWRLLFPLNRKPNGSPNYPTNQEILAIASNPKLVEEYRKRLLSLSWFHRCLNESIAKRANKEDSCTGRFWEGRFRSEPLTDAEAVVACSVYVDLNPIRAGIAPTPEDSKYTGIHQRIKQQSSQNKLNPAVEMVPTEEFSSGTLTEEEYFVLVDETGRLLKEGKKSISPELAPILTRLSIQHGGWLCFMRDKKSLFKRVLGPPDSLKELALQFGKQWFQGLAGARAVFA